MKNEVPKRRMKNEVRRSQNTRRDDRRVGEAHPEGVAQRMPFMAFYGKDFRVLDPRRTASAYKDIYNGFKNRGS